MANSVTENQSQGSQITELLQEIKGLLAQRAVPNLNNHCGFCGHLEEPCQSGFNMDGTPHMSTRCVHTSCVLGCAHNGGHNYSWNGVCKRCGAWSFD